MNYSALYVVTSSSWHPNEYLIDTSNDRMDQSFYRNVSVGCMHMQSNIELIIGDHSQILNLDRIKYLNIQHNTHTKVQS